MEIRNAATVRSREPRWQLLKLINGAASQPEPARRSVFVLVAITQFLDPPAHR